MGGCNTAGKEGRFGFSSRRSVEVAWAIFFVGIGTRRGMATTFAETVGVVFIVGNEFVVSIDVFRTAVYAHLGIGGFFSGMGNTSVPCGAG